MKASACLLMVLLAGVCVAQTRANLLDTIKDKVDDVKDKVTGGGDDQPKPEEGGEEKKDKDSYEGGLMKQVAHSMADAAIDRLAVEAKDQYGNPLLKPVISIAAGKIKDKVHDTINDYGEKPEEEKKADEAAAPPAEGQGEEKKGGLGGLIDKVMNRRKRGITSGLKSLKSMLLGSKKPATTTEASAANEAPATEPEPETQTAQPKDESPSTTPH